MEKQNKKALISEYKKRAPEGGIYSITNTVAHKRHIYSTMDLHGIENRFTFMKTTGSCIHLALQKEWKQYGPEAFSYEVLEALPCKETQTQKEYREDLKVLEELWIEKDAGE